MSKPTNAAIVDLNGRKWQPFDTADASGYVTYSEAGGEIHIPYGTDPLSITIQAHELSHVRYTAKLWPDSTAALHRLTKLAGTTAAIVGYAEDMRITALAGRLGVKTLPQFGNKDDQDMIQKWIASFVSAGIPKDRVLRAAQFILNDHTNVVKRIGLDLETLQDKKNAEAYITFCARYIHNLLSKGEEDKPKDKDKSPEPKKDKDKPQDKPKSEDKDKGKGEAGGEPQDKPEPGDEGDEGDDKPQDGDDQGDKSGNSEGDSDSNADASGDGEGDGDSEASSSDDVSEAEGHGDDDDNKGAGRGGRVIDLTHVSLPDIRKSMVASVPAPVDTAALVQTFQHTLDNPNVPWIPVKKIDRMPLVRRAAQARNRGRKLSETGVTLGSAYDAVAPNERRPFTAKRKGGAGGLTVVIDVSGSMLVPEAELEKLLLAHPQGVVVTYSSIISRYSGDKAIVRVIASHGRLAANDDFRDSSAGGNGCDGPVLEWLAKQSGEKVWICDGDIRGQGDRPVAYDAPAMAAWLKVKRITRFASLKSYINSLTKR